MHIVPTHLVDFRYREQMANAQLSDDELTAKADRLDTEGAAITNPHSNAYEYNLIEVECVEAEQEARELDEHDPHINPSASL
jgi:hypothetical protein